MKILKESELRSTKFTLLQKLAMINKALFLIQYRNQRKTARESIKKTNSK